MSWMNIFNISGLGLSKHNPIEREQSPEMQLRSRFASAAFGKYFRTDGFKPLHLLEGEFEFYEAHNLTGNGWRVRCVQHVLDAHGQKRIKYRVPMGAGALKFIDAMEMIANYDAQIRATYGEESLNVQSEVAKAGQEHYKIFAEREGLVFDVRGKLHIPDNGVIVTDGEFEPGIEEKATVAAKAAAVKRTNPFEDILPSIDIEKFEGHMELLSHINKLNMHLAGIERFVKTRSYFFLDFLVPAIKSRKLPQVSSDDDAVYAYRFFLRGHDAFLRSSAKSPYQNDINQIVHYSRFILAEHLASIQEVLHERNALRDKDGFNRYNKKYTNYAEAIAKKSLANLGLMAQASYIMHDRRHKIRVNANNDRYGLVLADIAKVRTYLSALSAEIEKNAGVKLNEESAKLEAPQITKEKIFSGLQKPQMN